MTTQTKRILIGVIAAVLLVEIVVVGIVFSAAFFGWRAAVRSGNEAAAIHDIKTIAAVQVRYYNTHERTFGTFDQLVEDGFDARFSGAVPHVNGYIFNLKVTPKTPTQPSSYVVTADPESSAAGNHHFYLASTDGVLHVKADQPAGPDDPPL